MIGYCFYETKYGNGGLVFSNGLIKRVYLPFYSNKELKLKMKKDFSLEAPAALAGKERVLKRLKRYCQGEAASFDDFYGELDRSGRTDFEMKVFKSAQNIPFGAVRSYRWVAEQAGSPLAYRAVGNALGKNPWPVIVPCHRVVRSNGTRGGWSGKPGWKERLQQLETGTEK